VGGCKVGGEYLYVFLFIILIVFSGEKDCRVGGGPFTIVISSLFSMANLVKGPVKR